VDDALPRCPLQAETRTRPCVTGPTHRRRRRAALAAMGAPEADDKVALVAHRRRRGQPQRPPLGQQIEPARAVTDLHALGMLCCRCGTTAQPSMLTQPEGPQRAKSWFEQPHRSEVTGVVTGAPCSRQSGSSSSSARGSSTLPDRMCAPAHGKLTLFVCVLLVGRACARQAHAPHTRAAHTAAH